MTSNILAYKPISSLAYKPNITLSITTLNCGATTSEKGNNKPFGSAESTRASSRGSLSGQDAYADGQKAE